MDLKVITRHVWGWFVVCVWIVGVPGVLKYAAMGIIEAGKSAKCVFVTCDAGANQGK